MVLSSMFFKDIRKNGARSHGRKLNLQCQEQSIDHIPYYLSGLSRAHFFPTTFLEIAVFYQRRTCETEVSNIKSEIISFAFKQNRKVLYFLDIWSKLLVN